MQIKARPHAAAPARRDDVMDEFAPLPSEGDWFVIHTRSRQEKTLYNQLVAMDVPCFLPLITGVRYHGHRKATVDMPIFPSYVFLRGSREQAFQADRTGRVVQIITVKDQQQIDWELHSLHLAVTRQAPLEPYAFLTKGRRVVVRAGPFMGIEGIVEDRRRDKLVLQINMLGRAMCIEIEPSLLDPLD